MGASNRARLARANPPIALELTVPTAHAHGGIIERLNASILSLTRALLLESGLGIEFWQWAVRHAVLLYNYRPHSSNPDRKSPYEMLYHKTPPYHKLRAWGCVVFTYVPQAGRPNRSKVDPTAQPRIYLGVPDSGIGHLVHNLATGRTTHRWSCIFDETARGIDGSPMGRVTWPRAPGSGTNHTGDTTEEDTDDDQTDEDGLIEEARRIEVVVDEVPHTRRVGELTDRQGEHQERRREDDEEAAQLREFLLQELSHRSAIAPREGGAS